MNEATRKSSYLTWGCSDDLAFRLRKTLYFCEEDGCCYDSSSVALTDVAVSMFKESAKKSRRKLSHRYASSLTRQLSISPCALMMSILYSERLRQLNPGYLERVASSDLYVVAMLVATKFLHDEGEQEEIYNNEWAEAAGLAVSTVNRLEREFLDAMDWNIYVGPDEFLEFCSKIETKIAFKYGLQRGWFSYTDLTQCLLEVNYQNVLKGIIENTVKVMGGCALVYGMSLSLLISSVVTYAATCTANKINTARLSTDVNTTTRHAMFTGGSGAANALYDRTFTYRRLTRERLSNFDKKNETFEMENDSVERLNITSPPEDNVDKTSVTSCNCASESRLCFEPRFQHERRQTGITYGYNQIEFILCNNQKDTGGKTIEFDKKSSGHRGLEGDDYGKQWLKGIGFNVRHDREIGGLRPTLFGTVVM